MFENSLLSIISGTAVSELLLLGFGIFLISETVIVIYRLYLSPLSKFPGPKIAAITPLYAFYHDVYRGGQYIWVIEEMHKKHGPIVRIRPDTVHINDAAFLDQVYGVVGKRRDKSQLHCNALMTPGAFVATPEHDLHRNRRAPLSPFFSKQSIRRLEPILQRCLHKVFGILDQKAVSKTPIRLSILFAALTNDIITEYAYGNCWNNLDVENLNEPFFDTMNGASKMWHLSSYVPWFMNIFTSLPQSVAMALLPAMKIMLPLFAVLETQIENIRNTKHGDEEINIFRGILESKLPESEKTTERLFCESRVLLAAGTDTTATALAKIAFHLLSNQEMLMKLRKELEAAIPDVNTVPSLSQVENLPYLNAIIQELLRLHPAGSMRQERVAPDEDLVYMNSSGAKYFIPKGTSMAMTAPLLSRNADLYPEPNEFRPERFLDNPHLDKYSLSWSRGSRICLGQNLAYAEMQLFVAAIFRKYDVYDRTGKQTGPTLELYETTRKDVDIAADFAVPFPRQGSKGVRVLVR